MYKIRVDACANSVKLNNVFQSNVSVHTYVRIYPEIYILRGNVVGFQREQMVPGSRGRRVGGND